MIDICGAERGGADNSVTIKAFLIDSLTPGTKVYRENAGTKYRVHKWLKIVKYIYYLAYYAMHVHNCVFIKLFSRPVF